MHYKVIVSLITRYCLCCPPSQHFVMILKVPKKVKKTSYIQRLFWWGNVLLASVWLLKILDRFPVWSSIFFCSNTNDFVGDSSSTPWVFVITASKVIATQKAELEKLSQTLRLVNNVYWIVVEDANTTSDKIGRLLNRTQIPFAHLAKQSLSQSKRNRGFAQYNHGLEWLRSVYNNTRVHGALYFADDDNAYDKRLFEYIRYVKKVGVWPVAFANNALVESPSIRNGVVVGWDVARRRKRPHFLTDIAGFAINMDVILHSTTYFGENCRSFYWESCFLHQIGFVLSDLEPYGFSEYYGEPTEILVWRLHTNEVEKIRGNPKRLGTKKGFEI